MTLPDSIQELVEGRLHVKSETSHMVRVVLLLPGYMKPLKEEVIAELRSQVKAKADLLMQWYRVDVTTFVLSRSAPREWDYSIEMTASAATPEKGELA